MILAVATNALFAAGATAAIATIVGTVVPYRHRIAALLTTGSQAVVSSQ